jgi:hypothetical protein
VNTFQGRIHDVSAGVEWIDRDNHDGEFDAAQRFIDAYWTEFDDPSGVSADLAELRLAVSGASPANPIRTRLTLHRLRRTCGNAAPIATVIALVRDRLDMA